MAHDEHYRFRLYVADEAQNSVVALANLTAICRSSIPDRYTIEVVDVLQDAPRALADAIFMTPTLLKLGPEPVRKIVGTLSDAETVRQALGLVVLAA
jgi:circadian clock protein KaiB